jgi:hypothetical protein
MCSGAATASGFRGRKPAPAGLLTGKTGTADSGSKKTEKHCRPASNGYTRPVPCTTEKQFSLNREASSKQFPISYQSFFLCSAVAVGLPKADSATADRWRPNQVLTCNPSESRRPRRARPAPRPFIWDEHCCQKMLPAQPFMPILGLSPTRLKANCPCIAERQENSFSQVMSVQ